MKTKTVKIVELDDLSKKKGMDLLWDQLDLDSLRENITMASNIIDYMIEMKAELEEGGQPKNALLEEVLVKLQDAVKEDKDLMVRLY